MSIDLQARIEKARVSKGGEKFCILYDDGDLTGYEKFNGEIDYERADLKLCSMLAFWLEGQKELIDEAFKQSALFGTRWEIGNYSEKIIERAIDSCNDNFYRPVGRPPKTDRKTESKEIECCFDTVAKLLQEFNITCRYDKLLNAMVIEGAPDEFSKHETNITNVLPYFLYDELQKRKAKKLKMSTIEGALIRLADRNAYNPFADYLRQAQWDGHSRLPELYEIMRIANPVYQNYIKKWCVQVVALGLNDEKNPIGANFVLTFTGKEGIGKTTFGKCICPKPTWYQELPAIDMRDKDSVIVATSALIAEIGEIDDTFSRKQSALKTFITRSKDKIRMPYARSFVEEPRRTTFTATTNSERFLYETTGFRRWAVIPLEENIDKERMYNLPAEWLQQFWCECYELFKQKEIDFKLTDDELKQLQEDNQEYAVEVPFESELRDLLDFTLPVEQWQWWRMSELKNYFQGYNAVLISKALKKVVNSIRDCPRKTTRVSRGVQQYLIPKKHH